MSTMTTQLDAIHSMLAAGHRCIRMRRHSLILWGLAGGVLCLATEYIITPARFPEHWLRALALLLFLGFLLGIVAAVDYRYTRHRVSRSDESLPFVEQQVRKVLWLLVAMGIAFTFATAFFGGGYMKFIVWLVLFGLGIYVHGLFSEQILEWVGIAMIVLGVAALVLSVPYLLTQWLAASAFGLGMPLLSTMLDRGHARSGPVRLAQCALWLAVVLAPPALAYQWWKSRDLPAAPLMSLDAYRRQSSSPAAAVVALPAGTRVPLKVRIGGGVVEDNREMILLLTLARPLELSTRDGKTDGLFREAGGEWKRRAYDLWVRAVEMEGTLTPSAGPTASLKFDLTIKR
jgi:hypothetical protein